VLSRNYIEVGNYLEQIFPFLDVRFLSVNDFFDSYNNKGSTVGLEVGFKTLLHDLYSKDLSNKIKSGKIAKIKKGEHIHSTAPFGYLKSKVVKNAWEIDEIAAVTIRRIFALALEGLKTNEIAHVLNKENIPTPLTHRSNNNMLVPVICRKVDEVTFWRRANVSRVLRDERYTGKLISGKTKKSVYEGKKTILMPESEWLVVPNAHEPIISQELFDEVKLLIGSVNQRKIKKINRNVLAGKVFCGHCHHALRRYVGLKPKYVCGASMELGNGRCFSDDVFEADITNIVLEALKLEIALAFTEKKQVEKYNKVLLGEYESISVEIKRFTSDLSKLKNCRAILFEDYSYGKLTKEQYAQKKSEHTTKIEEMEVEMLKLSDELSRKEPNTKQEKTYDLLKPFDRLNEVTPELMTLVDGIYVFDSAHIEIKFSFSR